MNGFIKLLRIVVEIQLTTEKSFLQRGCFLVLGKLIPFIYVKVRGEKGRAQKCRVAKESQEEPRFCKLQQESARFKDIDLLAEIVIGVEEGQVWVKKGEVSPSLILKLQCFFVLGEWKIQREHRVGLVAGEGRSTINLTGFKRRCKGTSLIGRITLVISHHGRRSLGLERRSEGLGEYTDSREVHMRVLCGSNEQRKEL